MRIINVMFSILIVIVIFGCGNSPPNVTSIDEETPKTIEDNISFPKVPENTNEKNVEIPMEELPLFDGENEDEVIHVLVEASLDPESKTYRIEIIITNKANEMIDIIADCGSYVSYPKDSEGERNSCPTVESMGIYKNSDVKSIIDIPTKYFIRNEFILTVTYRMDTNDPTESVSVRLEPKEEG